MWHPVHMKRSQSLKFPLLGTTINTQITEAQKGAWVQVSRWRLGILGWAPGVLWRTPGPRSSATLAGGTFAPDGPSVCEVLGNNAFFFFFF